MLDGSRDDLSQISMLPDLVLDRLTQWARLSRGGILEIGPYTGGSTIALARGNQRRIAHAVIECGGSHDHPTLASTDIIADWRRNMAAFGFADTALLCEGWSYDAKVQAKAAAHAAPIGLLFIDADGNLAPAVRAFAPYMRDDCLFVFDDYLAPGAPEKASMVRPYVDQHVATGHLLEDAVVHGTWFGRIAGADARMYFESAPAFRKEEGVAFCVPAPTLGDTLINPRASTLRLFEDGVEIGPAHSSHDEIRAIGMGRFSHWSEGPVSWLYMSTSDNSDPRFNGRRYTATIGTKRIHL